MPQPHPLQRAHEALRDRRWSDAYDALSAADRATPLAPADLESLAMAAYLIGRDDEHAELLERAHQTHVNDGDSAAAARCAFWIGFMQFFRGNAGQAGGWIARAKRMVEDRDCVEQGYLMLTDAERNVRQGENAAAIELAMRATKIGQRFGDADLLAAARHLEGRGHLNLGRMDAGLALLDDVMLSVTMNELSPVVTGMLYCSVIDACQRAWAVDRAGEWTGALNAWCDAQPGLVAFTAQCLVRRAEILQLRGEWPESLREAQRACDQASLRSGIRPPASAFYQQGEVHRLRGEFSEAESAYEQAGSGGWDPQPGLALLRLAQGRTARASQALARALASAGGPLERSRLLPAQVEISLAAGDADSADAAASELDEIAARFDQPALRAMSALARGQVLLASGNAAASGTALREAAHIWKELEAPWLAARTRALVGQCCRALGDTDGAAMELRAARDVFARLGAAPDLARLDAMNDATGDGPDHPLSARELEVIRLVAAGKTNRAIARQLDISEKTVARHMSNIFGKLGLSTRSAAAAWAWKHDLA